jgi:transcriptional regulator of acetoin/glycerol metabolism
VKTYKATPVKKQFQYIAVLLLASTGIVNAQSSGDLGSQATDVINSAKKLAIGVSAKVSGSANAPAAAPDSNDDAIKALVDNLKQQIQQTMAAYQSTTLPDSEKMKQVDSQLAELNDILDQTKDGGPLDQQITASYKVQKQKLDTMRAKANDPSLTPLNHDLYQGAADRLEKAIAVQQAQKLGLSKIRNLIQGQVDTIAQNKQTYMDMESIGDLENANKAMTSLMSSMQTIESKLEDMTSGFSTAGSTSPAKK